MQEFWQHRPAWLTAGPNRVSNYPVEHETNQCFRTHCFTALGTGVPSGPGLAAHGGSENTLQTAPIPNSPSPCPDRQQRAAGPGQRGCCRERESNE